VFKLQEIHEKHHVFQLNDIVLDLGCSPGSWALYAAKQVGADGRILGVDINTSNIPALPSNVSVLLQDAFAWDTNQPYLRNKFNVVMSDMAPSTTGRKDDDHEGSIDLCERALEIACSVLKSSDKATLIVKIFEGRRSQSFRKRLGTYFRTVKSVVPAATRNSSSELFLVARQPTGLSYSPPPQEDDAPEPPPP
jgi:23S rRNA (uridine2552-2'-O)-methyltransferase